ncbi:hypothetical protein MUK42_10931, partial [Musa troglodytarum]
HPDSTSESDFSINVDSDGPSMRANFNLFSLVLTVRFRSDDSEGWKCSKINLIRGLPDWTPALSLLTPFVQTIGFLTAVPSPVAMRIFAEGQEAREVHKRSNFAPEETDVSVCFLPPMNRFWVLKEECLPGIVMRRRCLLFLMNHEISIRWSTRFMMKLFPHPFDWDTTTWKKVSCPFNTPLSALIFSSIPGFDICADDPQTTLKQKKEEKAGN